MKREFTLHWWNLIGSQCRVGGLAHARPGLTFDASWPPLFSSHPLIVIYFAWYYLQWHYDHSKQLHVYVLPWWDDYLVSSSWTVVDATPPTYCREITWHLLTNRNDNSAWYYVCVVGYVGMFSQKYLYTWNQSGVIIRISTIFQEETLFIASLLVIINHTRLFDWFYFDSFVVTIVGISYTSLSWGNCYCNCYSLFALFISLLVCLDINVIRSIWQE